MTVQAVRSPILCCTVLYCAVLCCIIVLCYMRLLYYISGGAIHIRDSIDLCSEHNNLLAVWCSAPRKSVYRGILWIESNQGSGGKDPVRSSPKGAVADWQ